MDEDQIENQPPHDRRHFFRSSLSRVLGPAADYLEKKLPMNLPIDETHLRPPGALPEEEFLLTCYRCGSCADHCPADAISLLEIDHEQLQGTPQIDPDRRACVMCDDLSCMKVCPSGALKLVGREEIRIGLAVADHETCIRTNGEDCTTCLDMCPLGETAIKLDAEGRVHVIDPRPTGQGCTGCGVCQEQCPTRPIRAIRVHPY
ncbi:MAG: 4Fe-4S dicluster domain-containing protein [Phycisphaerales bacterium]|nr:4Fe-4S dicluster domain-containing protein [Phycisphaerales bacterium]